jgi:2-phosphosulfolactate phosphatase
MKIHITLTARDIKENELSGKVAVVIDVLRATSVIITALWNGARWIRPVAGIEEAFGHRAQGVLLGGERQAMPIDGFDLGNSPLGYLPDVVGDKGIVLSTTNGTLALSKCNAASDVLIGSFLNQQAVANHLIQLGQPVELICAGTNGEFSLDDFLCAGRIGYTIQQHGQAEFDDLGRLAVQKWKESAADVHRALSDSTHYNILKNKGFNKDLRYCLTPDTLPLVAGKRKDQDRALIIKLSSGSGNGHTAS